MQKYRFLHFGFYPAVEMTTRGILQTSIQDDTILSIYDGQSLHGVHYIPLILYLRYFKGYGYERQNLENAG